MNKEDVKKGMAVIFTPPPDGDGFSKTPIATTVLCDPWDSFDGQWIVMLDGLRMAQNIKHLTPAYEATAGAEILILKRDVHNVYSEHEGKLEFATEIEAQEKFDKLTSGGFEMPTGATMYEYSLMAKHVNGKRYCRRTMYTINKA